MVGWSRPALAVTSVKVPSAVVAVERVLTVVGDEEIVPAVVVVVADADALSPPGAGEAGLEGDVGEGAVAVVFEEMAGGRLALGEAFEAGAVHEEDVDPVVVVVVVEGDAAAGGFEQVSVLVLASVDGAGVEAGLFRDVDEADAERCSGDGRRQGFGRGASGGVVFGAGILAHGAGLRLLLRRDGEGEDVFEREDQCCC